MPQINAGIYKLNITTVTRQVILQSFVKKNPRLRQYVEKLSSTYKM